MDSVSIVTEKEDLITSRWLLPTDNTSGFMIGYLIA